MNSSLFPLMVAPAERLLQTTEHADVVLKQNTLLLFRFVVDSPAHEVLGEDALLETRLQVPVAPLLHLLVDQPHVDGRLKLVSITIASRSRGLVLPVVAIVLLVADIRAWDALRLPVHRA